MSYNINNLKIKNGKEYLSTQRVRFGTNLRKDVVQNLELLSKHTNAPKSKCIDILVDMVSSDKNILEEFLKRCKEY